MLTKLNVIKWIKNFSHVSRTQINLLNYLIIQIDDGQIVCNDKFSIQFDV